MTRTDTTMTDETADPILNAMKVSSEANVRQLSPAAKRALAEAEERRRKHEAYKVDPDSLPAEIEGRERARAGALRRLGEEGADQRFLSHRPRRPRAMIDRRVATGSSLRGSYAAPDFIP